MFLKKLSVLNYKNIRVKNFDFSEKMICFVGNNGVGKTNLLDAIYHLGMGKSYFNTTTIQNICHGENFYLLEGVFLKENREETIICSVKKGQKKVIKRNGKLYEKLSEHIGNFPVVIVSPSDRDVIMEGSEERRKFIDAIISQVNSQYLLALLAYNRALTQRNSLLKFFSENKTFDPDALWVYNEQLAFFGTQIHKERNEFLNYFIPIFEEQYQVISGGKEKVHIEYQSELFKGSLEEILKENQQKDLHFQYTTQGIHKDDLLFTIEGYSVKKFASQGQQKSFLTALKFAQFQVIKQKLKLSPILLLDDIFDKLDPQRVLQIIQRVSSDEFGQIFISDTHMERIQEVMKNGFASYQVLPITPAENDPIFQEKI